MVTQQILSVDDVLEPLAAAALARFTGGDGFYEPPAPPEQESMTIGERLLAGLVNR